MRLVLRPHAAATLVLASSLALGCSAVLPVQVPPGSIPSHRAPVPSRDGATLAWSGDGQASYALEGRVMSSPDQRSVPIASLAKVMTAYLTVHHLAARAQLEVEADDVADAQRRKARGESVVDVAAGEVLDRHQALLALLLPSANNVAAMLADRVAGNERAFVALMNDAAARLGMTQTTYTDPSGFARSTVSTARDQLLLFRAAMRSPELARVMGSRSAVLPVTGLVRNTNSLLGHGGFVAGKTGSTSAAGGCFVFRVVHGGRMLDGAVLGQRGGPLIAAGLRGALDLARIGLARTP